MTLATTASPLERVYVKLKPLGNHVIDIAKMVFLYAHMLHI